MDFFQSTWFYFLCSLLAIALMLFVFSMRAGQYKKHQKELEDLLAQKTKELKEASLRDPLTGLWNRCFVSNIAGADIKAFLSHKKFVMHSQSSRRKSLNPQIYFGIFLIDIDHFTLINDSYGHSAGDEVLKQFSDLLLQSMRGDDLVIRWGGEEFLVILKNTDYEYIKIFADKFKSRVTEFSFQISGKENLLLRKTCSIGYLAFPFYNDNPNLVSFEQAIDLANLGLRHAKQNGRNLAVKLEPGEIIASPGNLGLIFSSLEYGTSHGFINLVI